ncbi:type II toxin-antitoxin system RelE family toxin [Acetobacter fabarum]|uniref:type II toxin-antitoxin system RelE family toxin n=1 Tax=Acetobacter fabarum TaxID=483199 RepID=UPI0033B7E671
MNGYTLQFDPRALKEWRCLDHTIQVQFKEVLAKRLEMPRIEASLLSGPLSDCYKIKLRTSGYRLVYRVIDSQIVVLVLAIGERDKSRAYEQAGKRL